MTDIQQQIIQYIPHLRRYALSLLKDSETADDLVQDCLVRAMDRLHLFDPDSQLRTWLFTILHNIYINKVRRDQKRPDTASLDIDQMAQAPIPLHPEKMIHETNLVIRDIRNALDILPEAQKQVILLIALEQMSYAETADILDVPIGTVMSRLKRGREKLKKLLEPTESADIRRLK